MKKRFGLLLAVWLVLACALPNTARGEAFKKESADVFMPNQDLVERNLMTNNGLSIMAKYVEFKKDDKLKVYLEVFNTYDKPYTIYLNYIAINGWAMENEFFSDEEANLSTELVIPAKTAVPVYLFVSFPYVVRYGDMEIEQLADLFISLLVYRDGRKVFEVKTNLENPNVNPSYKQAYFDDGEELYEDQRIRVVFQGKDKMTGVSAYYIENKRNMDDWPLIYENILGNTVTDHVYSNRGESAPATFFLPANSKRLLFGPDIQSYCDAADLEMPTTAEIGVLFANNQPIVANVGVPCGTNVASWDFRSVAGNVIYQDKDGRIFYAGVTDVGPNGRSEEGETQWMKFVFENLNPKYCICLQSHDGTGRLDDKPVWVDMDYNVAAPNSRCVVFAKLSFNDGSPLDLKDYKTFIFQPWLQKRNNADWMGNYGRAEVDIWQAD